MSLKPLIIGFRGYKLHTATFEEKGTIEAEEDCDRQENGQ